MNPLIIDIDPRGLGDNQPLDFVEESPGAFGCCGDMVSGVALEIGSPDLHRKIAAASATILSADLVVTDRVDVVVAASVPAVFVGWDLVPVMMVVTESRCRSILVPLDVGTSQLETVASGGRVFSRFGAADLGLDVSLWRLIAYVSHGLTYVEAAERAGYSERHARRIAKQLCDAAHVPMRFRWPMLAALFPSLEEVDAC